MATMRHSVSIVARAVAHISQILILIRDAVRASSKPPPKKVRFGATPDEPSSSHQQNNVRQLDKHITNLCADLACVGEGGPPLGYLSQPGTSDFMLSPVKRHPRLLSAGADEILDLESIIKQRSIGTTDRGDFQKSPLFLSRNDRLQVAAMCSSTILRFFDTSWLVKDWSPSDLKFLRQLDARRGADVTSVFVAREFYRDVVPESPGIANNGGSAQVLADGDISSQPTTSSSSSNGPQSPNSSHTTLSSSLETFLRPRNPAIFTLGVTLIEIFFQMSLSELYDASDLDAKGNPHAYTSFLAANRLSQDSIYHEAGKTYGDVVRRCIRCEFDVQDDAIDIRRPDFRKTFLDAVVKPLETIWRVHNEGIPR